MLMLVIANNNERMTKEKWKDIVATIKEKFTVIEESSADLDYAPGVREWIAFDTPQGRWKLELLTQPVVLDRKVLTSRRSGGKTNVAYTYSESESTYRMHVYAFQEDSATWKEIKSDAFLSNM